MSTMDLWFYVSVAGFAISLLFWPYLLVQYRKASGETAGHDSFSGHEPIVPLTAPEKAAPKPQPVSIVSTPEETPQKLAQVSPAPSFAPAPTPNPMIKTQPSPADLKTGQTIPGGISPAVIYLQGVKTNLERLDKEMKAIRDQIVASNQKQDSQFNAIIKQLAELRGDLQSSGSGESTLPSIEPVAAQPSVEPEPEPAPVPTPAPTSKGEAAPPAAKDRPADRTVVSDPPSRKGPVWPV